MQSEPTIASVLRSTQFRFETGSWFAVASILAALAMAEVVVAANDVYIESKTVVAGARGVEVGIYLSNTPPLAGVHLPFEFREVTPGSFITDTLVLLSSNRLVGNLQSGVASQYFATQHDTLGIVGCWWIRSQPDFVSPDLAHYVNFAGLFLPARCLPSGSDGLPPIGDMVTPGSEPSLVLRFDVTSVPGTFEIDRDCVGTEQMVFVACHGQQNVFAPTFTKGVITIVPCVCECHGDPACDGVLDVADLTAAVDEAFGGMPSQADVECGRKTRCDINCDCQVDVRDVVGMIDVAIRGKDPLLMICDGCSDNCP